MVEKHHAKESDTVADATAGLTQKWLVNKRVMVEIHGSIDEIESMTVLVLRQKVFRSQAWNAAELQLVLPDPHLVSDVPEKLRTTVADLAAAGAIPRDLLNIIPVAVQSDS